MMGVEQKGPVLKTQQRQEAAGRSSRHGDDGVHHSLQSTTFRSRVVGR
jgi:hypothetical protein